MARGFALLPPAPLEIHISIASEKWKKCRLAWSNYLVATELNENSEAVQVATPLTVIGEEAREVYFNVHRLGIRGRRSEDSACSGEVCYLLYATQECTV